RGSPYARRAEGAPACGVTPANTAGPASAAPAPGGPATVSPAALAAVGRMLVLDSQLDGHLRADAPWAPWQDHPAHPAHRPVQWQLADAWAHLQQAGLDPAALGWPLPQTASPPWLAEHGNRGASAAAAAVGSGARTAGSAAASGPAGAAAAQAHNRR
ncbi:MAG: hypothetical protein CFE45_31405, partial [Burkholderiales bacterium PBB5]